MNIRILNKDEFEHWDSFIAEVDGGTIYHTVSWLNLICKTYGCEPVIIAGEDECGKIVGGVSGVIVMSKFFGKRFSSVPSAQECSPLYQGAADGLVTFLQKTKALLGHYGVSTMEIRMGQEGSGLEKALSGKVEKKYCTYILNLQKPFEVLLKDFHKDCIQRTVKRALKKGLHVQEGEGVRDVAVFYALYEQMRKENGLLPQPKKYFENIWELFRNKKQVEIFHALKNDAVVSSIMLLKFKDTCIYEYGATLSKKKKLYAGIFLLWDAIRRASEDGYTWFDFGRCSIENHSLRTFKKRWNASFRQLYYYNSDGVNSGRNNNHLMEKIMYLIVRISPKLLNRWYSELIYKELI